MATKTVKVEITGDPSSFERSMTVVSESAGKATANVEKSAGHVGGAFRGLDSTLGSFGLPFTGALSEIGNKFDELETHGASAFQKISAAGGLAVGAIGVAALGIGLEGVHLADQFEKAHANLETAVKNSGGSMEKLSPIIEDQTSKFARLGYTATEYEGALAAGTLATGSSQKALGLMSHAADLAAFSHTSLEKATIALAKASEGNLKPLKALGIDLPIVAANSAQVAKAQDKVAAATKAAGLVEEKVNDGRLKGTAASDALRAAYDKVAAAQQSLNDKQNAGSEIMDAVNKKTGGASAEAAETFQGKIKALEAELTNVGIKIGQFLIPIIEDLVGAISDVIDWFEKHKGVAIALAGVITTVLGAAIAVFVYDKVASFVDGIQRMIGGLTSLMTKSAETAAAVEADGAAMAESSAVGGAGVAAGGAGAAGGAAAAGEAEAGVMGGAGAAEGAGVGLGAAVAPVLAITAAFMGAAYAAGYFKDGLEQSGITADMVANEKVAKLSSQMQQFEGQLHRTAYAGSEYTSAATSMTTADRDHGAQVAFTSKMHENFNDILDKSPAFAAKFIAGVQGAGLNTDWYTKKLGEHIVAAEEAKNAQERFSLQMQIADARARGDTDAVNRLTYQMLLIPSDKQVKVSVDHQQAYDRLVAIQQLVGNIPQYVPITIDVMAREYGDFSFVPHFSDRNLKYNVVHVR